MNNREMLENLNNMEAVLLNLEPAKIVKMFGTYDDYCRQYHALTKAICSIAKAEGFELNNLKGGE